MGEPLFFRYVPSHWSEEAIRRMDEVVLGPDLAPSYDDHGDTVHVITTLGGTTR